MMVACHHYTVYLYYKYDTIIFNIILFKNRYYQIAAELRKK